VSTDAARVTLRLASGELAGPVAVHGAGGPLAVDAERAILRALRFAAAGRPTRLAEPMPGHARVYVHRSAGDRDERVVDLRGAELVSIFA
jgi:hypothetical protein